MAEARNGEWTGANFFAWPMPPVAGNPLFGIVTDINGKLLEGAANAQKDWAEFLHRRVQEDIAASRRLMNCQSLSEMQVIFADYVRDAFEQYRQQSERAVERGKSVTSAVVQRMETRDGAPMQRS